MVKFQDLLFKIFYGKFWFSAQLHMIFKCFLKKKLKNNQLQNSGKLNSSLFKEKKHHHIFIFPHISHMAMCEYYSIIQTHYSQLKFYLENEKPF